VALKNLTPGTVFARDFRVVKPLREGGMGAVYIAEQLSTGRQRALKLMAPELVHNPEIRERFVREAKVSANIESDHVVETVTAGVDDATGAPYLVMELLRGEELADAALRCGPLSATDVREVFAQIGHALEQAHAQGLVHRDLKPENIFLAASKRRDATFTAKILDFGIAKLVADGMQKTGTQPLGTPFYMAPEQTDRKGRICPATDVWALGLIAFYLLTLRSYWASADGGSLPEILREICIDTLPLATDRAREMGVDELLPAGFGAWFARCVVRDIDKRFPEAGEAVRAFTELVADGPNERKLVIKTQASTGSMSAGFQTDNDLANANTNLAASWSTGDASAASSLPEVPLTRANASTNANTSTDARASSPDKPAPGTSPGAPARSGLPLALASACAVALAAGVIFLTVKSREDYAAASSASAAGSAPGAGSSSALVTPSASGSSVAGLAPKDARCPEGMVYHPTGKTFMGSRSLNPAAGAQVAGRKVQLSSFCLDISEVTVRAYEACVADASCERTPDNVDFGDAAADPAKLEEQRKLYVPFCNARKPDRLEHPINCVSWPMADAYCKANKRRLPTEAEWEYAARGKGQFEYPWGNEAPDVKRLNAAGVEYERWGKENAREEPTMYTGDDGFVGTAPVGTFKAGASGYGVLDLAGNVWEWTADWYAPYEAGEFVDPAGPAAAPAGGPAARVIRGGAQTRRGPTRPGVTAASPTTTATRSASAVRPTRSAKRARSSRSRSCATGERLHGAQVVRGAELS